MSTKNQEKGFSLLEALVATFVFAIAIATMVKVLGGAARALHHTEKKQFAQVTAHNQLAYYFLDATESEGIVVNGGYYFAWSISRYPTSEPNMSRITVEVRSKDRRTIIAELTSFQGIE